MEKSCSSSSRSSSSRSSSSRSSSSRSSSSSCTSSSSSSSSSSSRSSRSSSSRSSSSSSSSNISRIRNSSRKEVILVLVRLRVRKIVASRKRFPSRYGSRPGFAEQERAERLVIEVAI